MNNETKLPDIGAQTDPKKKKQKGKAYENYAKQFTPKPKYAANGLKAFVVGGAICCAAFAVQNWLTGNMGLEEKDAKTWVTVILVCSAQSITGFANAMVSPAIEYKAEGPVLGVGAKLFSVAGPVLVCGITASVIAGIIQWFR